MPVVDVESGYEQWLAQQDRSEVSTAAKVELSDRGRARLLTLSQKLTANENEEELIALLVDHIENADDYALARIRPYELARQWKKSRRDVLELCLHATRAGILDLQWNLICPMCRGGGAADSLSDVSSRVHCDGRTVCRVPHSC